MIILHIINFVNSIKMSKIVFFFIYLFYSISYIKFSNLLKHVPRYLCSTFCRFLLNYTHLWKKCNSYQETGKFQRYFHWHIIIFHSGKIHKDGNRFLTKIYKVEYLHFFSILSISRKCLISYHSGLLQYKIPIDIEFFSRAMKTGAFQLGNHEKN